MWERKTKKFWSRLGAGMLLGLSLFNLGSFFNQNNSTIPKSAGNFRRKEETQINPELKGMLQTVEEEAKLVISQQSRAYKNLEVQQLNWGQTLLRYGVVFSWLLTMGIIFSSLIFNFPLALGRWALSALPGTAHTAILKITADKTKVSLGEEVGLKLSLKSLEEVSSGKVFLEYPAELFFLERVDSSYQPRLSFQPGGIELIFNDLGNQVFRDDIIGEIFLKTTDEWNGDKDLIDPIKINWEKSLVLGSGKEKERAKNILGKTIAPQIAVILPGQKIFCQISSVEPNNQKFWQEWSVGPAISQTEIKWNVLTESHQLGCVFGSAEIGFLITSERPITEFALSDERGEKQNIFSTAGWQSGQQYFQMITLPRNVFEETNKNWKISWREEKERMIWPLKNGFKIHLNTKNN